MISFGKKPEGIHANHALKHRNSGEIPEDHSVNRPAYINHIHDKSSRERNPIQCHSPAEKVPATVTARDAIFLTFADTLFAFSVGSDNRSSITGKGEAILMDEALFHGDIQKFFPIDFKERSVRLVVDGKRCFFQLG